MFGFIAKRIFGTKNDRVIAALKPLVQRVAELESKYKALSDEELRNQTSLFKQKIEKGADLDSIEADAFAVVREAGRRILNMRHFDVQIIGGAILHRGTITEMRTGEGKTLVATLPAYLNALTGKGVHIVTVNDYLARRDSEWMGQIYRALGLSVGVVVHGLNEGQRKAAYGADITYGQNNEFGFDYLRDNMKLNKELMVQRGHNFAVVDEVDSILIDEARTPLIISGPSDDATEKYYVVDKVIPSLKRDVDYIVDQKSRSPTLNEEGIHHIEKLLGIDNLYDPSNIEMLHHVTQGLKAHVMMTRDVEYVVENNQVVIIDEFTGRKMPGRRWSDGLHQAVEAKEGLKVAPENQTLATITFQNYFRMYSKLAGMTGTADTEAVEFKKIYNLDVVVIPTNKPMVRIDHSDLIYKSRREKSDAVINDIQELHKTGQPILVGTISIEQSEHLSSLLRKANVKHNVLNAKQHEREAEIVAQAGRLGALTISTNMAGRGTDIMLGGNPEFLAAAEAGTKDHNDERFQKSYEKYCKICEEEKAKVREIGGLFILGTERHEARRIDNQLRGRSGRQGDPGTSRFYISLEDDLMMRFGGERMREWMTRFGMEEGQSLEGSMVSRAIEKAQLRVEAYNFDIRKHLLELDDVMNKQRQVVYGLRSKVLYSENIRDELRTMVDDLLEDLVIEICDERSKPSKWDLNLLTQRCSLIFNASFSLDGVDKHDRQSIYDALRKTASQAYDAHRIRIGDDNFKMLEQQIFLLSIDRFWKDHLLEMDHLKEGINLRGYGQKNPLYEYQREGFLTFQRMLVNMKVEVVRALSHVQVSTEAEVRAFEEAELQRRAQQEKKMAMVHAESPTASTPSAAAPSQAEVVDIKDPEKEREKLKLAKQARRKLK